MFNRSMAYLRAIRKSYIFTIRVTADFFDNFSAAQKSMHIIRRFFRQVRRNFIVDPSHFRQLGNEIRLIPPVILVLYLSEQISK